MSLVDVYDALKEAKVSDQKAAAAVKAIEAVREEARLRRIEERIAEMNTQIVELRAEMNGQNAKLRADMEKGFGELRTEMGEMRSEIHLLKWMCGGILGLMAMAFIRIMFG